MNPIQSKQLILQGHSRPIKDLKFSQNGDLIFSASNDRSVISWNVQTGEKIQTFTHSAAVNIIALTNNLDYMVTGDNTGGVYVWDIQGGILLKRMEQDPSLCVRTIAFSNDDSLLLVLLAGRVKGAASFINIYKMSEILLAGGDKKEKNGESPSKESQDAKFTAEYSNLSGLMKIPEKKQNNKVKRKQSYVAPVIELAPYKIFECQTPGTKWVQAKFALQDKSLIISREDGYLELINFSNGKQITQNKFHDDVILDFDYNFGLILTASRDGTSCVINFDNFLQIMKFHPQNPTRNLNACRLAQIINPNYEFVASTVNQESANAVLKLDVDDFFGALNNSSTSNNQVIKKQLVLAILSGGQDSKLVTTTNQKEGGFEILIYDAIDGLALSNFLTHFGPVNTLAVSQDTLASGAEDATVRIYKIQNHLNYLFPFDKNK
jgi:WD40 repeat protein